MGPWVEGRVLLFDLGYFRDQLFDAIDRNDEYFISRLATNADPCVAATHRQWRGRAIELVGKWLKEVAGQLKRDVLDVEVEVAFKRRAYGGIRRTARRRLRLVAVRLPESSEHRFYLTNIDSDSLDAHAIAQTYAARWQIELIFKELKSHYRLEELPTRKAHIVETLLLGTVITLLVSRRLASCRAGAIATHVVQDARRALGCDLCRRRTSDTRYRSPAAEGIEGDCPAPRIDAAPRGPRPQSVATTAHRTRRMWCRMGMILCN